jgi:hypothetical protein
MDMSFPPKAWPQWRSESRKPADSDGPEWRELMARLDAAQAARDSLGDSIRPNKRGSFSPGSARNIEALGSGVNEDNRAINQGISGNGKSDSAKGCAKTGKAMPGGARN